MGSARTLAQVYRRFAEADRSDASPLYKRVALALSESDEALRAIECVPARKRNPAVILAALHDLAIAGRAPALAAAYTAADGGADAPARAAIDALLQMTDAVADSAVRRPVRADETGRYAVLYPVIAEAARRSGAKAVGLIDIGRSAGLNLNVDRVGITYRNGPWLGDPSSPVQLSSRVVQDRPVPTRAIPEVVARIGVDLDPIDVTNADPLETRQRFLRRLGEAAAGRAVAWVSAEGVGVAPTMPTLGDRPASGHSIIGLALFGQPAQPAEAIGRCWSRGHVLAWLAES